MRILDEPSDKVLGAVTLYLKESEAKELRAALEALLSGASKSELDARHEHVSSDDYQKELTVCLYREGVTGGFSERSKRIILEDR